MPFSQPIYVQDTMSVSACGASHAAELLLSCVQRDECSALLRHHILTYTQSLFTCLQAPKSTGAAGMLSWAPSPCHSDGGSSQKSSTPNNKYYERELDRLKSWHPQKSRFGTECERKSGGGAAAAPHSFFHPRDTSPEQH